LSGCLHDAQLDEEFRYLQRKKNVVKEFADMRRKAWQPNLLICECG
jgi:hypothetical protein